MARLSQGRPYSISQLTAGSRLTRQAITKHLRVLEGAGIVYRVRAGRESRFQYAPEAIRGIREYLEEVAKQWDQALSRLQAFLEQ